VTPQKHHLTLTISVEKILSLEMLKCFAYPTKWKYFQFRFFHSEMCKYLKLKYFHRYYFLVSQQADLHFTPVVMNVSSDSFFKDKKFSPKESKFTRS
jgi:hypothetical protein